MFKGTRWIVVIAVGLCLGLMSTGCQKYKGGKKGKGYDGDLVSLTGVEGVDTLPLGDVRFEEGEFYGGQFEAVYFDYDSAMVRPSERVKIEAIADHLKSNANARIIVTGHCDERGSNEYNLALGERRALAVRAYLTNLGADPDMLQTKSLGEEEPVAFGHDEESWRLNRRSEFLIAY
jgi:peptidoglycan-associated lipoprotein